MKPRYPFFQHRPFYNYFIGDILACFGNGLGFIGMNWYIRERTGSDGSVGKLMIVYLICNLVIFPMAGTLVDSFQRRTVMIILNYFRACMIITVTSLLFFDISHLFLLYVLAGINGAGTLVYQVGTRALMQELLDNDKLIIGNSVKEISFQVGLFVAAGAAGLIYKLCGAKTILFLNAFLFIISNYFFSRIKTGYGDSYSKEAPFSGKLVSTIEYVIQNKMVAFYGMIIFIPFVVTVTLNVILPGYSLEYLSGDSITYGTADMCYGIGAFLSGFIVVGITAKFTRNVIIIRLFYFLSTTTLFYLIFNGNTWGLFTAMILLGIGNSSLRIVMQSLMMEIVPKTIFGRMMSIWFATASVMQIVSVYVTGRFMDAYSDNLSFIWLLFIMLAGFLLSSCITPKIMEQTPLCREQEPGEWIPGYSVIQKKSTAHRS